MKKDEQRVIDEQATALLKTFFADASWQLYDIIPDIAKDHLVELVEEGRYGSIRFIVQLKGKRRIKPMGTTGDISFKIETKYLKHYIEKERAPVFLIVVDVTQKVGYWLFIQRYIHEALHNQAWRDQQSISVRIPSCNLLSDRAALRLAVVEADKWMLGERHDILATAVSAICTRYEALDSRFRVDIAYTNGQKHVTLRAKEHVDLTLSFIGESSVISSKVHDLIHRGLPVAFEPHEIEVSGSKLLQSIFALGGTIQHAAMLDGVTVLHAEAPDLPVVSLAPMQLKVEVGATEARLAAESRETPVMLSETVRLNTNGSLRSLRMTLQVSLWQNKPIRQLIGFKSLAEFFCVLAKPQGALRVQHAIPDLPSMDGVARLQSGTFERLLDMLNFLRKCRAIAEHYNVNPVLAGWPTNKDIDDIEMLYDLLLTGRHQREVGNSTFSTRLRLNNSSKFLNDLQHLSRTNLRMVGDYAVRLFDTQLVIPQLELAIHPVELSSDTKEIEKLVQQGQDSLHLHWRMAEGGVWEYKAPSLTKIQFDHNSLNRPAESPIDLPQ